MSSTLLMPGRPGVNPLDVVEEVVLSRNWPFERPSGEDLATEIPGSWCAYQAWFAIRGTVPVLQFTCAMDMRVPAPRRGPVYHLLGLVNERLWLGHFDLWSEEGQPVFRHTMALRGAPVPNADQIEDLVDIAYVECERFYPALQHVIWAGKTPAEALALALIDTAGEA